MATRIRLQRRGKKNQPFYHIVIADGRAPRDGRFIEKIGIYNPLTNPATINIDFDRALYWVETGASPSDTARSILRKEGVYLMKHLKGGIAKGALTEIDAERKFDAWKQDKESKVSNLKRELADKQRGDIKKRMEAETKVKEAISAKVAAKYAQEAAKQAENDSQNEANEAENIEEISDPTTVEPAENETPHDVPVEEPTAEEVTETPAEETTETPAE